MTVLGPSSYGSPIRIVGKIWVQSPCVISSEWPKPLFFGLGPIPKPKMANLLRIVLSIWNINSKGTLKQNLQQSMKDYFCRPVFNFKFFKTRTFGSGSESEKTM